MNKKVGHWAKNINAMKWTKPEEFENLIKMAENEKQTALINNMCQRQFTTTQF